MICTDNKKIFLRCQSLKNLCFGKNNRFNHSDIGWNYRLTNLQSALGYSQLKRINSIVKKKKEIGHLFYKNLVNNKHIYIPPPKLNDKVNIYWVVGIVIKSKVITAKNLSLILKRKNIDSRPFFFPMSRQKILRSKKYNFKKRDYPNSYFLSKYGLYLPSGLNLKKKQINYITNAVNEILD